MPHRRRPLVFCLLLALGLAGVIRAQNTVDLRIEVDQDGLHEVTWESLSSLLKGAELLAEKMTLTESGREVPILLRGLRGERFGARSSFVFYGQASQSTHSRRTAYRLGYGEGRARLAEIPGGTSASPRTDVILQRRFEEDLLFAPWATIRADILDLDPASRSRWFWDRVPAPRRADDDESARSFMLDVRDQRPMRAQMLHAKLDIRLRTPLARVFSQKAVVLVSGHEVGTREWTEGPWQEISVDVPTEHLAPVTLVRVRNVSTDRVCEQPGNQVDPQVENDFLIDSIRLRWPSVLLGPSSKQKQIRYELPAVTEAQDLGFVVLAKEAFLVFDVEKQAFVKGGVFHQEAGKEAAFIVCTPDGHFPPAAIAAWSARRLATETEGGDWVVVTTEGLQSELAPLVLHRRAQGLVPFVVTDREVYDAFSGGRFDPSAITRFLESAAGWRHRPRFLLLVGDAAHDADWADKSPTLPCRLVDTLYNGASASDEAFLPAALADVAVGRLPFRRREDLLGFVARLIHYETAPEGGEWRRKLSFVVSEGRFGPAIDPLIERFGVSVLANVVPARYAVEMTYASARSSYLFPPAGLESKVLSTINEGTLALTYIGHGYTRGFDQLRIGKERFPILREQRLPDIDARKRPPVLTIVACSTAEFDSPAEDSFAEELLRHPGGPIAVIAATRVSHPFPNAILGRELAMRFFAPEHPRVGEILSQAKARMLAVWRDDPVSFLAGLFTSGIDRARLMNDHRHLYVLLGDPATQVAHPALSITLEVAPTLRRGESLPFTGKVELPGATRVRLSLEAKRTRMLSRPNPVENPAAPESAALIAENHQKANDKSIWSIELDLQNGSFAGAIQLPAEALTGDFDLVAVAHGDKNTACASRPLKIE